MGAKRTKKTSHEKKCVLKWTDIFFCTEEANTGHGCQLVKWLFAKSSGNVFTSCAQREPTDARSRPLWRAGVWLWPRRTTHSWCWSGRPGIGSACSCGPPCCCCCCGASAPWAWSGSWSGSLPDLKSFFPGWTPQRRTRRWMKRRGKWRDTQQTAGEAPSRPRGCNRGRCRRSGHPAPAGRRTAGGNRTGRGAGTGCRSACTGPPASAGSSGTPAWRVLCYQHRRKNGGERSTVVVVWIFSPFANIFKQIVLGFFQLLLLFVVVHD